MKNKLKILTEANKLEEQVRFIGKYTGISEDELRQKVLKLGGTVNSVTTSTFTAECPVKTVIELARLESISYIELSKTVYLKN